MHGYRAGLSHPQTTWSLRTIHAFSTDVPVVHLNTVPVLLPAILGT